MTGEAKDDMAFSGEEGDQKPAPIRVAEGQRRVYSDKSDPTIQGLYRRFQKGRLILQPDFQRGYIWDDAKASRLVESVLLEVPIPNFYLSEEVDGNESVVDGQQRLTSFFRVFQPVPLSSKKQAPQLRLRSLRVLTELNGKVFSQWGDYQSGLPPENESRSNVTRTGSIWCDRAMLPVHGSTVSGAGGRYPSELWGRTAL